MKLKMCSCRTCKLGRGSGYANAIIRRAKKAHRMTVRTLLRKGDYDNVPVSCAVGYTD